MMLGALGHTVVDVAEGSEALRRLHGGERFDLVLSDLAMPGMNGWEIIQRVKDGWPGVRVAIMTGAPGTLAEQRESVATVILKPVTLEDLRQALRSVSPQN